MYIKKQKIRTKLNEVGAKAHLTSMFVLNDYSLSVMGPSGVRYFTREEALAYISSVEMIDLPLTHLQEEFEEEFGSSEDDESDNSQAGTTPQNMQHQHHHHADSLLIMFYKRIRTQLVQLKEFLTVDLMHKLNVYLGNTPLGVKSAASSPGTPVNSIDDVTRDSFNLNKLMIAATTVGKVFGIYTGSSGKILWSFFLPDTMPFRVDRGRNPETVLLFVQRTAAHVPHEAQCSLITKTKSSSQSRVFFFNPLTGRPSKEQSKQGLLLDYQVKQAFLASNAMDTHYLKPLILFDTENRLHVLPEKAVEEVKAKLNKPSIIYATSDDTDRDSFLVGYWMRFDNQVCSLHSISFNMTIY